jgi:hypothetical protein
MVEMKTLRRKETSEYQKKIRTERKKRKRKKTETKKETEFRDDAAQKSSALNFIRV